MKDSREAAEASLEHCRKLVGLQIEMAIKIGKFCVGNCIEGKPGQIRDAIEAELKAAGYLMVEKNGYSYISWEHQIKELIEEREDKGLLSTYTPPKVQGDE